MERFRRGCRRPANGGCRASGREQRRRHGRQDTGGCIPFFCGQAAAARQALQSRKSAQRLLSMQHLTASRALAPAAECCIDNNRWADFLDWRACRDAAA